MSAATDIVPVGASVVIPVGAVDAGLDRQVEAVFGQTAVDRFECILALNCPTPIDPADVARRWEVPEHISLRVLPARERRGAAYARNIGARHARGDLLAFCDADDVAETGWLYALIEALAELDAVTGCVIDVFPDRRSASWHPPATPDTLPRFLGRPYLLSGNLGVRRAAFEMVGGFDESLTRCEDIALGWALTRAGFTIGYAPDAHLSYFHRVGFAAM
ncbi:MAG: glycosyltransferase, partial [Acidimicrobiia bacterium]